MGFFSKLFGKKEPEKIIYLSRKNAASTNSGNTSRPVWRMADGTIDCPGDACPKTCDETCPIYCQTLAVPHFRNRNVAEVERLLRKAIALEPELSDAWSTLGTCRGASGDNEEAYRCFKKAYDLGRRNEHVLDGLLVSCQHTNRPDEGLKYCAEYEKFDKEKSTRLFNVFLKMKGKDESPFAQAEEHFKIPATMVWETPEIWNEIHKMVVFIREVAVNSPGYNHPISGFPILFAIYHNLPEIIYTQLARFAVIDIEKSEWMVAGAFYAGYIGVQFWNENQEYVETHGMAEVLSNPGVINRTSEFTHDLHNENSPRHKMSLELESLANLALNITRDRFPEAQEPQKEVLSIVMAMYVLALFGMQLKMAELGMKASV